MILDYLGHSEFIATLKNKSGKDVTILSDTWLSDYIVGDLMGRNPTFSLDYSVLTQIDAIFISHAHTDHLDPYILIEIYAHLVSKPILLIPETLTFLKSTFEEFLPEAKILIMRNKEKYDINGISVRGYIFENE
jgi:L-ascorbate metabolism protein UlaG (beta-lactamase superfamily)